MTITRIANSYSNLTGFPGYLVGTGYGRAEETILLADRCGEWLAKHIGQSVTVRRNSDCQSGGTFRNGKGWEC